MPDPRECAEEHRAMLGRLLSEAGCDTPIGASLFDDEHGHALLIGQQGRPTARATLYIRTAGRWVEMQEAWHFDPGLGKLEPASYRYAVFDADPQSGEASLRWELHPLPSGRSREIYGQVGFPHLHVGGDRAHVPTGVVTAEIFLRYVIVEGTDVSEDEAARFISLTREAGRAADEWRSF